jgi:hypothetical protein
VIAPASPGPKYTLRSSGDAGPFGIANSMPIFGHLKRSGGTIDERERAGRVCFRKRFASDHLRIGPVDACR